MSTSTASLLPLRTPQWIVLLAGLLLVAQTAVAQPAGRRIISDVLVTERAQTTDLTIEFTFPVRYVSHYPEDFGDTIEIQLKDVVISSVDAEFLHRRESVRLPKTKSIPLLDISYEGDLPGGPYLTVRFVSSVSYTVSQGSDFRSLVITVNNNLPGSN
jgi:hypothetical protein